MPDLTTFLENREKDGCWTNTRFKKLNDKYKYFRFPYHLADIVEKEEFQRLEEKRLPIFIALNKGRTLPPIKDHFGDGKEGVVIAILYQYMRSTYKTGIQILYYKNNQLSEISYLEA